MKKCLAWLLTASICGLCVSAFAAEAIPSYTWTGPNIVGFAAGGAGFQFSPTATISVTSLGYGGTDLPNQPYRVSLWDSAGAQLTSATISSSSLLFNWSHYESISSVTLTMGHTYYLSGVGTSSGSWVGEALLSGGSSPNGTFTVGPDINYMAGALGTTGAGIFPSTLQPNYALFIGPNFQYAVVPEPGTLSLAGLALLAAFGLRRLKA